VAGMPHHPRRGSHCGSAGDPLSKGGQAGYGAARLRVGVACCSSLPFREARWVDKRAVVQRRLRFVGVDETAAVRDWLPPAVKPCYGVCM